MTRISPHQVTFHTFDSPLGKILIAIMNKRVCMTMIGNKKEVLEKEFLGKYPQARILSANKLHSSYHNSILSFISGKLKVIKVPLILYGTSFQKTVWRELQKIPYGKTSTYKEIAKRIGFPRAYRAVANACAANSLALLIPCHRVIRSNGRLGGYRWGIAHKKMLLKLEKEHTEARL
ncbi:methylated-DNA--[protein]-cysteine S-methyltransferase [Candidatus Gottesmanbacteria bacterium]|nr:methylated-DNA--[protein]-cysteine S-methyltransferase [Candidatus Gottesmanbacteria bacterium]